MTIFRKLLATCHFFGLFLQLLFYCWSSHQIILSSVDIRDSIYTSKWYLVNFDTKAKEMSQCVRLIINRSTKPCVLNCGIFFEMSLGVYVMVKNDFLIFKNLLPSLISITCLVFRC